ncbi:PEGA domain-containing protein [Myxococcus sp. K15C18031901]|uniref:PEGA domain-containing protein n=1 Tax=Myxococcus dinghuensis TaxID=2906761 RepID=UPI0020A6E981|nr:PEGA domain-containing protein [Myxococcus dinghuensis]MCP3103588.1 PEGA domain-containing protein [Myxococcus dinghuensis]
MKRLALLLILLSGTTALAARPDPSRKKVVVLPFQAVSGDVPARAGPRLAARLASEVHGAQGLALVEATPPSSGAEPAPTPDVLTTARAAVREATAARDTRDFARADAALSRALDAYAQGLPEAAELADTYALRAAVRFATGRDDEATLDLSNALAVAPDRDLPLAATSPLFTHTVERVRTTLGAQPPGTVRFDAMPPGIAVTLDGVPVGPAPVRVTQVPPGAHLWRAALPSGDTVGGIVEARSGAEATVTIQPSGTGPSATLAHALADNRLDTAALQAAAELGRAAGADLVIVGTLSRAGPGLAVDTFLVAPGDAAPRRLPRMAMDLELLDAGAPLRTLVAAVATRGLEAGLAESVPLSPTPGFSRPARPTQATYTPPSPERARPAATPERRPEQPIRKPLVRP